MTEAIIGAIIAAAATIFGQWLISRGQHDKLIAELEQKSAVSDTEIKGDIAVIKAEVSSLRKEVEKHNGVMERTFQLEKDVGVLDEKIKVANNRIGDLERKVDQ